MTLDKYRREKSLTLPALAKHLGLPYNTTCSLVYGHRRPSIERIIIIEKATKGAVKLTDWATG